MEENEYNEYIARFCASLESFSEVVGIAALGSTAGSSKKDKWSDHDFAIVLRGGDPERFLSSYDWMPNFGKIIAHARHFGIYAAAVYDDGHKAEYLVCDECAAREISVTRLSVLLDRGGVREALEQAEARTLAQQQRGRLDANPTNNQGAPPALPGWQ
jgi:hypothetical protein